MGELTVIKYDLSWVPEELAEGFINELLSNYLIHANYDLPDVYSLMIDGSSDIFEIGSWHETRGKDIHFLHNEMESLGNEADKSQFYHDIMNDLYLWATVDVEAVLLKHRLSFKFNECDNERHELHLPFKEVW